MVASRQEKVSAPELVALPALIQDLESLAAQAPATADVALARARVWVRFQGRLDDDRSQLPSLNLTTDPARPEPPSFGL